MTELGIEITGDQRAFSPGETIDGRVTWQANAATSAELRLFWYTRGKGTQDVANVDSVIFENPQPRDRREFRLALPKEPYSFSGKLISLVWAIELILEPGTLVERREIVMSPTGQEIELPHESA